MRSEFRIQKNELFYIILFTFFFLFICMKENTDGDSQDECKKICVFIWLTNIIM